MNSIGAGLRKQREAAGYSVKQVVALLARRGVNLSEKTVYSWETGRRQPDAEMLMLLCEIYGTNDIMAAFGHAQPLDGSQPAEGRDQPREQLSLEMERLVKTINQLSPEDREYITELAKRLAGRG